MAQEIKTLALFYFLNSTMKTKEPYPEGYENERPLNKPKAKNNAQQTKQMSLSVGDTIIGREGYFVGDHSNGEWWQESMNTLLWVGEEVCVWKVKSRRKNDPQWRDDGERANWTMDCRRWYLVK